MFGKSIVVATLKSKRTSRTYVDKMRLDVSRGNKIEKV